jgi:hypothetical protein
MIQESATRSHRIIFGKSRDNARNGEGVSPDWRPDSPAHGAFSTFCMTVAWCCRNVPGPTAMCPPGNP